MEILAAWTRDISSLLPVTHYTQIDSLTPRSLPPVRGWVLSCTTSWIEARFPTQGIAIADAGDRNRTVAPAARVCARAVEEAARFAEVPAQKG